MDTKHKPRLNRQKTFWAWGAFDLGGLLAAYGISSGGAFDRGDQNQGASDGGSDWPGGDWPVAICNSVKYATRGEERCLFHLTDVMASS